MSLGATGTFNVRSSKRWVLEGVMRSALVREYFGTCLTAGHKLSGGGGDCPPYIVTNPAVPRLKSRNVHPDRNEH